MIERSGGGRIRTIPLSRSNPGQIVHTSQLVDGMLQFGGSTEIQNNKNPDCHEVIAYVVRVVRQIVTVSDVGELGTAARARKSERRSQSGSYHCSGSPGHDRHKLRSLVVVVVVY